MRKAWKPIVFVLISFIIEEVVASFIFSTKITPRNDYVDLTIAQALYYSVWPIVTFVLLHKIFKLTKWTPGYSVFAVFVCTGGIGVALFKKYGLHSSPMATSLFAFIWLACAIGISCGVHERYKERIQKDKVSKSYISDSKFMYRFVVDASILFAPLAFYVLFQIFRVLFSPNIRNDVTIEMGFYACLILISLCSIPASYFRASFIFSKVELFDDGIVIKKNTTKKRTIYYRLNFNHIETVSVRNIRKNYMLKKTCKVYVFQHHKWREHYLRYDINDNEQFENDLREAGVQVTA